MKSLQYAAEQTVRTCLDLKKGERTVVIYDRAASRIAAEVINAANSINPGRVDFYLMESYGERTERNPLKFPGEIGDALREAKVSFLIRGDSKKGESRSFTYPLIDVVESNPKLRHAHMPGVTEESFLSGMSIDYQKLRTITRRVNDLVKDAKEIRVTTPAGSDFYAQFSPQYKWVVSDGFINSEMWGNLPGSETFTCPKSLDGKIVVDGDLGDYFDQKYGLLDKNPLTLTAQNGRVVSCECPENRNLEEEFREYIARDGNANRFGEFAIGTNVGLEKLLGNMLHDEKFPGVHVAVGSPYPSETGAEWDSVAHCDMVVRDCNIVVDGQEIMSNGRFSPIILSH